MSVISETTKAYIAGFLDGDGCVMYQLVRRKDYVYGYQIRASVAFYQKTEHRAYLERLKSIFKIGYLRDRPVMTDYTIVGLKPVMDTLVLLEPYVVLKQPQIGVAKRISEILEGKFTVEKLVKAAEVVDEFGTLNYSKKRTNTSSVLKEHLRKHGLYPCND